MKIKMQKNNNNNKNMSCNKSKETKPNKVLSCNILYLRLWSIRCVDLLMLLPLYISEKLLLNKWLLLRS